MKEKENQKIVIIGGGFGGVKAALELANKPGFDVKLITPGTNFEYHGALYRSATGHSPTEVVISLATIFKRAKNVELIHDKIVGINPIRKTIKGENGQEYIYDTAILSLGNCINYFGIDGMDKHSFGMITVRQTIELRSKLVELFRTSGKTPRISVVGAGATGVELAGELRAFARKVSRKYGNRLVRPEVTLIEGADRPLPNLDPILSAKAYKRLLKLGIKMRLNTRVNSCEAGKICLDGGNIDADLIVWTAGSKLVDFYSLHPKVFDLEKGKVKINQYLQVPKFVDVYVIGDNANTPFSGMAQTALHDAKFVTRNLLRIQEGTPTVAYRTWHPIYVVPIGGKWAVLQSDKHQISGYQGWLMRRRADRWIFKNFLPYRQAIKQWSKGNHPAKF